MPRLAIRDESTQFTSKRAHDITTASWMIREAKEVEIRLYFKEIPVSQGLHELSVARKMVEIAAFELNQRIEEGVKKERCSNSECRKTLEESGRPYWSMMGTDVDPKTGVQIPYRFCSPICVRARNRKLMMPEGASTNAVDGSEMGDVR